MDFDQAKELIWAISDLEKELKRQNDIAEAKLVIDYVPCDIHDVLDNIIQNETVKEWLK